MTDFLNFGTLIMIVRSVKLNCNKRDFFIVNFSDLLSFSKSRRQSSREHNSLHHLMLKPVQRFPQILALLQVGDKIFLL